MYRLRVCGVDTVVPGGLVVDLCIGSRMRALMENGFKVYVVKDAVAALDEDACNSEDPVRDLVAPCRRGLRDWCKLVPVRYRGKEREGGWCT
ncbi:MAG: isochorismatase family protein [Antarcticimicrobium sp.]|nr:isochorismatase family protein [Antarcticimicrobium sp.]MDF1716405.1 isochorismatase family protein [Antarcticimicrobium sp.]